MLIWLIISNVHIAEYRSHDYLHHKWYVASTLSVIIKTVDWYQLLWYIAPLNVILYIELL